jgi:regulation of enolase protein 1 (concanavalin A-like superfamily)
VDLSLAGLTFPTVSEAWEMDRDSVLTGSSGPRTDLFVDPSDGRTTLNAPRMLTAGSGGDYQLSALVEVDFQSTYDAGVLLLWANDASWAKLCFEYSPQRQPMVVSVVTKGRSDDANAITVDGPSVWLRVSARREAYAFHASTDGDWWHLVRHFTLDGASADVGFVVQSPLGDGCRARFSDVTYVRSTLEDLRDGR